jgi:hypothetical protein
MRTILEQQLEQHPTHTSTNSDEDNGDQFGHLAKSAKDGAPSESLGLVLREDAPQNQSNMYELHDSSSDEDDEDLNMDHLENAITVVNK